MKQIKGDCIEIMRDMPAESVDAIVTDPPYALSFMGKDWDSFGNGKGYQAWCEDWARECLRVLKPGGHMLAFGGTRTYHRLACAVEDAGFEIRDSLHWIYGSGFPKSLDVSKAIDKAAGAEREVTGGYMHTGSRSSGIKGNDAGHQWHSQSAPSTPEAQQWAGWGTALKPAHEPIIVARKPLAGKTVASNVTGYGTGGINIDACRIVCADKTKFPVGYDKGTSEIYAQDTYSKAWTRTEDKYTEGRWPPNVILTHSPGCSDECMDDCPVAEIDRQSGISKSPPVGSVAVKKALLRQSSKGNEQARVSPNGHGDSGGASRFFPVFRYQAKAPRSERPNVEGIPAHPTVKPLALMQWLVRLVTPPGGTVLDPFAGTGATAEACILEGFNCVTIELNPDYIRLASKRLEKYSDQEAA